MADVLLADRVEERLGRIWATVLDRADVHGSDNFFDLGGDSIMMIEVCTRAAAEGLHFTPLEMISYQTVAELASVVVADQECGPESHDLDRLDRAFPLTPVQQEILRDQPVPNHLNQSALWGCTGVDPDLLARAFDRLTAHHEAFRLRLERRPDGGRWQRYAPSADAVPVSFVDLSGVAVSEQDAALLRRSREAQEGLDVAAGPLLRAVLFDLGPRGQRLFVVVHHLVVDGVSWRIIRDDLTACYQALAAGTEPELPASTTPFGVWSELLAEEQTRCDEELGFWSDRSAAVTALPWARQHRSDISTDRLGDALTRVIRLDPPTTAALVALADTHSAPGAGRGTRLDAVLLGAVAAAVGRVHGMDAVGVDVERHGRVPGFGGVDVGRSIGWFTQIHPVAVSVTGSVRDTVAAADRELRDTPTDGLRFGLLARRHRQLADAAQPGVLFNYLGRSSAAGGFLTEATEQTAPDRHPDNVMSHPVEVSAAVEDGELVTVVRCAGSVPDRHLPERISNVYLSALRELADSPARGGQGGNP